ncbi:MAG: D-alanine--D-alanine ligase, partial [Leptospiraceae bacterium]|nr:D-alanine--D-alanine ligase [Leptospiraceae bacterium]
SEKIKSKSKMPEKLVLSKNINTNKIIQSKSLIISKLIGISGYARLDWKLDASGNPKFLEINLTPGLSFKYSTLPLIFQNKGISYKNLIKLILKSSLYDYKNSHFRTYGKL